MFYRCLQKKGIYRKNIRQQYKKRLNKCKTSSVCRIKEYIVYFLSNLWNWIRFLFCVLAGLLYSLPLWIFELFRFCPFKVKQLKKNQFLIIGHRGAAAHEIENTIYSMEMALEKYGANALEIDLSMTKDQQIVLWHDWDPDSLIAFVRQAGLEPYVKYRPFVPMSGMWRKPVNQLLLEELREHYGYALKNKYPIKLETYIPTFPEFINWATSRDDLKVVLLDVKIPVNKIELVPLFMHILSDILTNYKPQFTCIILSPEEQIIRTMKDYFINNDYSLDIELPAGLVIDAEAFSSVNKAIELQNSYASVGRPTILNLGPWTTYRRVIQFDKLKKDKFNHTSPEVPVKKLIGWTINNKREMKCLLKMGIDGILTDRPDKLSGMVQKYYN